MLSQTRMAHEFGAGYSVYDIPDTCSGIDGIPFILPDTACNLIYLRLNRTHNGGIIPLVLPAAAHYNNNRLLSIRLFEYFTDGTLCSKLATVLLNQNSGITHDVRLPCFLFCDRLYYVDLAMAITKRIVFDYTSTDWIPMGAAGYYIEQELITFNLFNPSVTCFCFEQGILTPMPYGDYVNYQPLNGTSGNFNIVLRTFPANLQRVSQLMLYSSVPFSVRVIIN